MGRVQLKTRPGALLVSANTETNCQSTIKPDDIVVKRPQIHVTAPGAGFTFSGSNMGDVPGRAESPDEKRSVNASLLVDWQREPHLRLGQLIYNAVAYDLKARKQPAAERDIGRRLFYAEDEDLALLVQKFVTDNYPDDRPPRRRVV